MLNKYKPFIFFIIVISALNNTSCKSIYHPVLNHDQLISDLRSSSKETRDKAVMRLSREKIAPDAQSALIAAYESGNDEEIKKNILNVMQLLAQMEQLETNLTMAYSKDINMRLKGYVALGYIDNRLYFNDERVFKLIKKGMLGSNKLILMAASTVIGFKKDIRGLYLLLDRLNYKEDAKVIASIRNAVISIGRPSVSLLIERLLKDSKGSEEDIFYILGELMLKDPDRKDKIDPIAASLIEIYYKLPLNSKLAVIHLLGSIEGESLMDLELSRLLDKEDDSTVALEIIKVMRNKHILLERDTIDTLISKMNNKFFYNDVVITLTLKGEEYIDYFISRWKESDNILLKDGLIEVIVGLNNSKVVPYLIDIAKKDSGSEDIILPYIVRLRDYRLGPYFIKVLKGNNPYKVKYAVTWLNSSGTSYIPELVELLNEKETDIRLNAVSILKKTADNRVIEPLIELLKQEENKDIRADLISILGNLKAKEAVPAIITEMIKGDKLIQMSPSVHALIKIGEPAAHQLIDIIRDGKMPGAAFAAYVLAMINNKEAVPYIRELAKRSDSGVVIYLRETDPNSFSLQPIDAVKYSLNMLDGDR